MKVDNIYTRWLSMAILLILGGLLCWLLANKLTHHKAITLEPVLEYSQRCETAAVDNVNTLKVHVPVRSIAMSVLSPICQDPVVARQYGAVTVFWGSQLAEQIEFLSKGIADVILSKENIMSALMAESTQNFMPVLGYPSYSAFFISNTEKPKLTKAYFLDKRIGLVDYPTSRSGHILPKSVFKSLDLDIDALDIKYFSSHRVLRDQLAQGKVDIISTYWSDLDEQRFSKNYITPIASNVVGSKWYLKMSDQNVDLACSLQKVFSDVAHQRTSSYFEHAQRYWQCQTLPYGFKGANSEL